MTKSSYKNFTCFLKDEQFVMWQISPDEQLNEYWGNFILENPHLKDEVDKAALYLKNTVFASKTLPLSDKKRLYNSIKTYVSQRRKAKRRTVLLTLSSVAAVAILLITLNYMGLSFFQPKVVEEEMIVGDMLYNEDIQLITSNETAFFNENLQMEFDEEGNAIVAQIGDKKSKTINLRNSKKNKLVVPYGKRSTLTLSDGSKLWLNSGSVLEFPAKFERNIREITLASGELYIEVTPDKKRPFFVRTSDINVEVLGTKFNVANYADSPQTVVLVEGAVSLQTEEEQKLHLKPSEQAILTPNGTLETEVVDVDQFVSWSKGYLFFDEAPMSQVLQKIERYYNISFNYDKDVSLKELTCSGRIVLSENLDNVMTTIALLTSTKYNKIDGNIYISHKTD